MLLRGIGDASMSPVMLPTQLRFTFLNPHKSAVLSPSLSISPKIFNFLLRLTTASEIWTLIWESVVKLNTLDLINSLYFTRAQFIIVFSKKKTNQCVDGKELKASIETGQSWKCLNDCNEIWSWKQYNQRLEKRIENQIVVC